MPDPTEAEREQHQRPWLQGRGVPQPAVYEGVLPPRSLDVDAVKVLRRLSRHGYTSYLVGGGVRDILLGRDPKDFDVATSARPNDVRRIFRNCRIIGRRFRLAHILFADGKIIECATFRRDPDPGFHRLPPDLVPGLVSVVDDPVRLVPDKAHFDEDDDLLIQHDNDFGDPWEDAIRRDFTINGLMYDHSRGAVIDYVGGMADVHRRLVRTIGDPGVRFREDPVRILRAIKFSARLDLGIDPAVYAAMIDHRHDLRRAARPRVFEELFRLMRGGAAHRSLYLAWDTGILEVILPELTDWLAGPGRRDEGTWRRLLAVDDMHARGELPGDTVLFAALLLGPLEHALSADVEVHVALERFFDDLGERLNIPRRVKDRVGVIVAAQRRLRAGKLGGMPRRAFFAEAAQLHLLDCAARGIEPPAWALNPPEVDEVAEAPRRRRRRRRRR